MTDETQKKRCLLETSSLLPPLKSSQFASMPKPGCTCSHMHGAVVKVHWAKEGEDGEEHEEGVNKREGARSGTIP